MRALSPTNPLARAGRSAAAISALLMIVTLGVASAADAPRAPSVLDVEQDASVSRDKRYRLVGAAVPASPEKESAKGTLAAGKYRLQGGVVGIEIDPAPASHREANAARRAKRVDILDVLSQWGMCPTQSECTADADEDGIVGPQDLIAAIEADRE